MTSTYIKKISLVLSKEDLRLLEELKIKLGENTAQVFRRALAFLHTQIKIEYPTLF